MTFEERCRLSEQCLPEAPYREMLTKLHNEMLRELAEQPAQQEPVAWRAWFDADNSAKWLFTLWPEEEHSSFDWQPLYTSPPQRTWVGLIRGVRVEENSVVITVKGGNDAARELCGELVNEMEVRNGA